MPCLFFGDCCDLLGIFMPKIYLSIVKIHLRLLKGFAHNVYSLMGIMTKPIYITFTRPYEYRQIIMPVVFDKFSHK